MNAAQFDRVQHLFLEALERSPDRRAAFLDAACDDPELRRAVDACLAADAEPDAFFLDEPIVRIAEPDTPGADEEVPEVEGRRIGPYRLIRLLGRGGMGAVYLAEREDVGREVALKVVRGDLADPTARKRFLFERRVLGRLEHPLIARLYDAGVGDDGTPYFAMEFIDGLPLTEYCDRERLGLDERLQLFERVGRAVQHAHQHFIIHRDLKPSNILVTPEGEVKLLDFGIAKALDEAEGAIADGEPTLTGRRLLTPAYAAPEQRTGAPVTAATDVYSLGVVLFELLTGTRPDTTGEPTRSPKRPSTVVTETTDTGPEAAEARQTTTERLARRLRGDLDVICLKALQPEADRRYASAEGFVEDVRRHLEGLPVKARPDSAGYRARKFIQRHRQGVLVAVVAVLLLGLLVGFYTARLEAERDLALREAQKAERVATFLADLFGASDPYEVVRGDTLRARALLERGAARIETELAAEPEIQAAMLDVVGDVYLRLGLLDEADPLLERALALRRETLGEDDPEVAESMRSLGQLRLERGAFAAVDSLGAAALAVYDVADDRQADVARTLHLLGQSRLKAGDFPTADSLLRRAHALFRRHLGDDDRETIGCLQTMISLEMEQSNDSTAAVYAADVLAARRRSLGPEHPLVAQALNGYGYALRRQGRYDEAERRYREALAMKRRTLGDDHPDVAATLNNLGVLLGVIGRYDEIAPIFEEALAIRRHRFGADHPLVASSLNNLSQLAVVRGDFEAALEYQQESLDIARAIYDGDHPMIASMLLNQGEVLKRQGRYRRAETRYREALEMERRLRGGDHEQLAMAINNVGSVLLDQGRHEEARPYLDESLAMHRRVLGEAHVFLAIPLLNAGRLATAEGRYAEAERLLIEALRLEEKRYGVGHARLRTTRAALVELYQAWGKPDEAARYRDQP